MPEKKQDKPKQHRTEITVAIIGAVAVIATAVITGIIQRQNDDGRSKTTTPTPPGPTPLPQRQCRIAGLVYYLDGPTGQLPVIKIEYLKKDGSSKFLTTAGPDGRFDYDGRGIDLSEFPLKIQSTVVLPNKSSVVVTSDYIVSSNGDSTLKIPVSMKAVNKQALIDKAGQTLIH